MKIANVRPEDVQQTARSFGPRFDGPAMRAVRWSCAAVRPRHFAHFVFAIDSPGFRFAKEVLFALQAKSIPNFSIKAGLKGLGGLSALAFSRFFRRRLHIPANTPVALQLDLEQERVGENAVTLTSCFDKFGRPRANIHWTVSASDLRSAELLQGLVLERLGRVGHPLPALSPVNLEASEGKLHDAYHPVGTTRMGEDSDAVVDFHLRVRGVANLYALTTGVFPSAGSSNPTFSLLCLARDLGERLTGASQ
jgi:hypothetical protein